MSQFAITKREMDYFTWHWFHLAFIWRKTQAERNHMASCLLPFTDLTEVTKCNLTAGLSNIESIISENWVKDMQEEVNRQSHIMGGRSSFSSQNSFFCVWSSTSRFLSSTFSSTVSFRLCLSDSATSLQVWAIAQLGRGVIDGEERGRATSVTDVLGVGMSSFCFVSSNSSPLHFLGSSSEGGAWGFAATVGMLVRQRPSDKAKITRKYSSWRESKLHHIEQKTASDLLSICWNSKQFIIFWTHLNQWYNHR